MYTNIKWKKNLYEFTDLPDNYTDSTFLTELRKNVKSDYVSRLEAINLGASISIRLSIPVLFVIIFIWLYNEWTTPNVIIISEIVLTIFGYLFYNIKILNMSKRLSEDLRTTLIFLIFGYILSPVLRTLTETISTDTIYAMTILMFLTHLIFNKYGSTEIFFSDSLSINSSIFGSLMLASRLASPLHAFSLLTVSVQFFVLFPILLSHINNKVIISIVITIGTVYLLLPMSNVCSYVFIIVIVFIHFICPLWYIRCKQFKNNIYGPWDEAIIIS
ncbi:phosphatidylinositol N-acetylglucosaminyltransferase subunit C-like [Vespa mandarinia]|uniref:phosphatidylinositol N-acetylglucosaminyltransferase subunit C-like n=1 Tax=Vespa mandarinia TaxID=7446 RepID=UPI00160A5F5A|nr:phosphatidylinositol N-acetylglucosaminyltransferase subunit C-like [Vespa mandarinia]XP_046825488.1 phosphatidylinositol N-acetylglucosaminyltransferase subunit C [Vespa crabro]